MTYNTLMDKTQLTSAIYQALEALNGHGQIHDYYCPLLWTEEGDVNYAWWNVDVLRWMEWDLQYNCA